MPPRGHIPTAAVFNILGGEKYNLQIGAASQQADTEGQAETEVMAPEGGRSHVESLAD